MLPAAHFGQRAHLLAIDSRQEEILRLNAKTDTGLTGGCHGFTVLADGVDLVAVLDTLPDSFVQVLACGE